MLALNESINSISENTSIGSTQEEYTDEEESLEEIKNVKPETTPFNLDPILTNESRYLDLIRKNDILMKQEYLDLQPSWEGMKISTLSREQFDMSVHAQIIKALFLKVQMCVRTAGHMKNFLRNDGKILKMLLCSNEADQIIRALVRKPEKSNNLLSAIGTKLDHDMTNACIKLVTNPRVQNYIHLRGKKTVPGGTGHFEEEFMNLYETINPQLIMTAGHRMERTKMLRKARHSWEEKQHTISALVDKINKERDVFDGKMKLRELDMVVLRNKMNKLLVKISAQKNEIMKNNESVMTHELEDSEYRQENLSQLAKEAVENYQNLLNNHLAIEKNLRARRFKIESQLMNWLIKYDTVILAKQENLDEVIEGLENENRDFFELQCLYNEQKHIYNKYREQYNKEQAEELANQIFNLRANRAARIIQRRWRLHRQNKLLKRALRKEKNKAKVANAAGKMKGRK